MSKSSNNLGDQCKILRSKFLHTDPIKIPKKAISLLDYCKQYDAENLAKKNDKKNEEKIRFIMQSKDNLLSTSSNVLSYFIVGLSYAIAAGMQQIIWLTIEPLLYRIFNIAENSVLPFWFIMIVIIIQMFIFFVIIFIILMFKKKIDRKSYNISKTSEIFEYIDQYDAFSEYRESGIPIHSKRKYLI